MIKHIVMWKFKKEILDHQKPQIKENIINGLEGLVGKVPGLVQAIVIVNPIDISTHDMALVSRHLTEADLRNYRNHPEHLKIANTYVRPFVCERCCFDYEVAE